jgi:hypothetical protein
VDVVSDLVKEDVAEDNFPKEAEDNFPKERDMKWKSL